MRDGASIETQCVWAEMSERWITIDAERVLYVHRGRDVILCDDHSPGKRTIVVKVTEQTAAALAKELQP
jgi:hypothetical protein